MSRFAGSRFGAVHLLLLAALFSPCALAGGADTNGAYNDDRKAQASSPASHHHHAKHKTHPPEVTHSIMINAKPQLVWAAIQHQRESDNHRKLISYDGKNATLKEVFAALPIVGEASCTYVENETSQFERIDYALVQSDRFHVFEGAWVITPGKDQNSTNVELTNAIDPGIRVPFWQDVTKMAASKLVKRRLDAVCAYAEQLQKTATP
ncbi:MAG: SRPBCC family protein [Candidatus Obscuribacterales bacterium]|nr:SRPBCC family protein [Candidatus Obscuribacterales bacterium]